MLARFNSDAGLIIMFGDVAVTLLKMMGQSGVIPGAIRPEDIPAALERLKQALAVHGAEPAAAGDRDPENEPPVTLRQRAFPLIELLARAARRECHVVWEEERSSWG
jgi:hypothetical protein